MYDMIVIGAGTAGLSAVIYGKRNGKKVLMIEEKMYGGQIVNSLEIENYPGIPHISGYEFAYDLYRQAEALGMEVKYEHVNRISVKENGLKGVHTDQEDYVTKAIIIATGAKARKLGLELEKELTGKGISYCAACDGAFFKDRQVAVVGGGNTALEDAIVLSHYCRKVYVIHWKDVFQGEQKLVEELEKKSNVRLLMRAQVHRLLGSSHLSGIEVMQDKIPIALDVDGVFVAIGHIPDNSPFSSVVAIDQDGYIIAGEDCRTDVEGIYAAGDCRTKLVRQLTTAAADGAVAAINASRYCDQFER